MVYAATHYTGPAEDRRLSWQIVGSRRGPRDSVESNPEFIIQHVMIVNSSFHFFQILSLQDVDLLVRILQRRIKIRL